MLQLNSIITARKRSLGQGNIFTPVCHSVHGGGGTIPACIAGGISSCLAGGYAIPACMGDAWSWGFCSLGVLLPVGCLVETPPTATAAGGTHPTGMHSCFSESAQRFQFSHSFFPEEGDFCKRYYTGTVFGEMSCSQNSWNKILSKVKWSLPVQRNFCEWIDRLIDAITVYVGCIYDPVISVGVLRVLHNNSVDLQLIGLLL